MKKVMTTEKKKLFGVITLNKYGNPFKRKLFIFFMLLIPMANFLIFTVYANIGGVWLSFNQMSLSTGTDVFVGFANYCRFFEQFALMEYGRMIAVSFGYLIAVMFVSVPISLVCSFFLYKKVPLGKIIVIILFLPNILPASVLAEYYRQLFDPINGIVNKLFNLLGGYTIETAPSWLTDPRYSNYMLYLYTVWFGFGYNAILLWGAMTRIPQEVVESAQLDGAGMVKEFFKITIPIIWPTFSMVIILTWMVPFTLYMQPMMISFNGQANTTTIALLALQTLRDQYNPYYASAISIIIALVSIPTTLLLRKALDRVFTVVEV